MFRTSRTGGWLAGLLLLQCQAGPAPYPWIRLGGPELELLTNGEAAVAAEAVAELANLRSAWRDALPVGAERDTRLRIVAFASEAEYQPFRINAFSPAYFVGGVGQDTIVLGHLTRANFPALRHEFVHHLLRARWRSLPLWLEEGLADYYGGVDSGVGQMRASRLRRGGMLSLQELASVGRGSASYQDREAARQFYAQSWALTHLLMTAETYRAEAWVFVDLLNQGESLESAVEWVYGRSLPQLQEDLAAHLGRLTTKTLVAQRTAHAEVASTVGADEVKLELARLLVRKGDLRGAQEYLDELVESSRGNPELWSLAGDLALKQGRSFEAQIALQEALRLGSRDARGLRQLAVLEQRAMNRSGLEPALARLVEVDPADDEARGALASLQASR